MTKKQKIAQRKRKKSSYWRSPDKCRILQFRIAVTTADALEDEARRMGISTPQLARLLIEQGMGFPGPGMRNADSKIWPQEWSHSYY